MEKKTQKNCCINDNVSEYARFTFSYLPRVDRWCFTYMTCHQASAEVSSSKTLSAHQLQAAVLQRRLPSDLTLSEKVCFPLGSTQDCVI